MRLSNLLPNSTALPEILRKNNLSWNWRVTENCATSTIFYITNLTSWFLYICDTRWLWYVLSTFVVYFSDSSSSAVSTIMSHQPQSFIFFHNSSLFTPITLFKRHPTSVRMPVAPVIYDTQVTLRDKVLGIGTFVWQL